MLSRALAPANASRQGLTASARVASRRGAAARTTPVSSSRAYSASAGSSSSSSATSSLRRRPVAIAATAAAALTLAYVANKPQAVHLDSGSAKRMAYHDRMKDENRKQRKAEGKETSAPEESSSAGADDAEAPPAAEAMDELSEEASQESAFDPETNTINWDCPCLGGMAHGPCGEEFKTAFSCFVFSEAEPKGIDCVDNFKAMQDCFRKHPEHYKEELEDFDEADEEAAAASSEAPGSSSADGSKAEAGASSGKGAAASEADDGEEDEAVREWKAELAKEK